jgi:hypothetical protein
VTRPAATSYAQASPLAPLLRPSAIPPRTTYTPAAPSAAEPETVVFTSPVSGSTPVSPVPDDVR